MTNLTPGPKPSRPHGTRAAIRRHERHGEPLCEACRQERNRLAREMYAKRTNDELMSHLGRVFDARGEASEGHYCECETPRPTGTICGSCGLCVRRIEIEQVLAIVSAHDFKPHERHPEMCAVCSNWADHRRHHGHDDIGKLRDGTPVNPAQQRG